MLASADVVIWLGPRLEPGLVRYMQQVPPGRLITLEDVAGLQIITLEPSAHLDGHVWLSPSNVKSMAQEIAAQLQQYDLFSEQVLSNAEKFINVLDKKVAEEKRKFDLVQDKSFIAVHDGFAYLAAYFDLHQLGYLIDANEQAIGVRAMWRLQQQAAQTQNICLLGSPQYGSDHSQALGQYIAYHEVSIDIIGSRYTPGHGVYLRYLDDMLAAVHGCLVANTAAAR